MASSRLVLMALPLLLAVITRAPAAPGHSVAAAGPAAAGPTTEAIIVNRAARTVNELYISPVTSGDWGADRLGEGTIAPGRSLRVRLDPGGGCSVDLQVVYDDASREERHGVDICRNRQVAFDGSHAVVPAGVAGGAHPVVIVNGAARPIQQVFISPAESGDWGDDLLANGSLSVDERATLTYRGVCLADLRIVYDNRSAEERRDVDVCALHGVVVQPGWTTADLLAPLPPARIPAAAQAGPAVPVIVSVTNHAGRAARALFIYPEGSAARGENLLGATPLDAGGRIAVDVSRPPGACRFTAHVEFAQKQPGQDMRGLDLCRSAALVLSAAE